MSTFYANFDTITVLQKKIVRYVDYWAHVEKTPISQKKIVEEMTNNNENQKGVIQALEGLLKQGYIRKAISSGEKGHSTTKYVLLRRV